MVFTFFGLLTFENCFSNKILCSWLNILRNSATFSYLFANKSTEFRINRFYILGRFSFIMKFMVIFVRKHDQIFQWFEHFIFFIFLFAIFRSSLNNIFTFSLLYLVLQVTLKEVNRYISLTQNFQRQFIFFVGWVCFVLLLLMWSCSIASFFFCFLNIYFLFWLKSCPWWQECSFTLENTFPYVMLGKQHCVKYRNFT